jgi:hypothetical protein
LSAVSASGTEQADSTHANRVNCDSVTIRVPISQKKITALIR